MGDAVSYDRYSGKYIVSPSLSKDHTYVIISGLNNDQQLKVLEKSKKINILFKGPMAVNTQYGHGDYPRNTIVVFELKE
jgi:hypothetical protein